MNTPESGAANATFMRFAAAFLAFVSIDQQARSSLRPHRLAARSRVASHAAVCTASSFPSCLPDFQPTHHAMMIDPRFPGGGAPRARHIKPGKVHAPLCVLALPEEPLLS